MSLCPECLAVIPAIIDEVSDRVWMEKKCPRHGEFRELISTDVAFYRKLDSWNMEDRTTAKRACHPDHNGCPNNCGLCEEHVSSTMMAVIDITNRCNLRCPICFANAAVAGRVCEMSLDQIKSLMAKALKAGSVNAPCVQFSGGEPTLHPEFLAAIRAAGTMGFAQVQIASNGIRFAQDAGFTQAASEAGLNVIYLQFDGVDDGIYQKTRGRALWDIKNRAVENLRRAGIEVVLVPTLIKGVNDHQIGDIFRYAAAHTAVIVGISWQPVSFVGRIDYDRRLAMRFTLADLARELEQQTDGQIRMHRDWYPLSFVSPFSRLLKAITGQDHPTITCHRHCGAGTYVLVDPVTGLYKPITAMVDVEGLMARMDKLAKLLEGRRWFKKYTLMRSMKDAANFLNKDETLPGWGEAELLEFMNAFAEFRDKYPNNAIRMKELQSQRYRSLLLVAMHFQDVYNFEVPRAQHCVIHYTGMDGKQYPFCTYNGGPCFRERVEGHFVRRAGELLNTNARG